MAELPSSIVIVGGGLAGASCALELRSQGYHGALHLFAAEPHAPYERPPLSKAVLAGESATYVGGADAMADLGIIRHAGATAIDTQERLVTGIDGTSARYEAMLFATGRLARAMPAIGDAGCPVVTLRTLDDALQLAEAAHARARIVIVGAGLIGMEVAAQLATRCAHVTLIEAARRPMARAVPEQIAEFARRALVAKGVDLRLSTTISAIDDQALTLSNGRQIVADLILGAIGSVPEDGLATNAGLQTDNGVVVDAGLRTSVPGVFAAGDVVVMRTPIGSRRFENHQAAELQGRLAARNMLGADDVWREPDWFWSEQGDLRLEGVGVPDGDRTKAETLGDGSVLVRVERAGAVAGMFGIGGRKAMREVRLAQRTMAAISADAA